MNFTILFRGGSRYAVQKGQRTVGFNFLYLARETYPNVSDANISCKMTSRMDTDYLLTLTEDQARESGFLYTNKNGSQYEYFLRYCQLLCNVPHGYLNGCVDIVPKLKSNGVVIPVYSVNAEDVYTLWSEDMYNDNFNYWTHCVWLNVK